MKLDLKTKIIGQKIHYLKEIDSTNEEAKRLAKHGAPEGTVVLAECQTRGKGKPGRRFSSEKGGIYLSLILKPYVNQSDFPKITLLFSKIVVSAIKKATGLKAKTKWPNDVLVNGKKVSGILAEVGPKNSLIIGIGINVRNRIPSELQETATSLVAEGYPIESDKLVPILLQKIEKEYQIFLTRKEI